jgi:hypothetical protein
MPVNAAKANVASVIREKREVLFSIFMILGVFSLSLWQEPTAPANRTLFAERGTGLVAPNSTSHISDGHLGAKVNIRVKKDMSLKCTTMADVSVSWANG